MRRLSAETRNELFLRQAMGGGKGWHEDEVDEAVRSEFTRQQTGALELLLSPPLALHSQIC